MSGIDFKPTIGIETHVQLKTKTKLFSGVSNDARGAGPNTLISHICSGMPGALPILNRKAVELAVVAAYALNSKPSAYSKFDRKHYFYPDLPKGYQITQYDEPIIKGGWVEIQSNDETKKIGISRVHLEEDAGKNTHPEGADYSLVDLNRAGTPLLEIVSEPQIHSARDAKIYTRELWLVMRYAGVTDGDLYHGHVRFDVNVSLSKAANQPGIRTEVKNLNSFKSVEAAINYEIARQLGILKNGGTITQETRGWDEVKQRTTTLRHKEEAHDYRYFPDPDIPPLMLDAEFIKQAKNNLFELPQSIRKKFLSIDINRNATEDILDKPDIAQRVLTAIGQTKPQNARQVAFHLLDEPGLLKINLDDHIRIAEMVTAHRLSSTSAKAVLNQLLGGADIDAAAKGREQLSDENEISGLIETVLEQNQKAVSDITRGETKALGFLVGQIMKISQGRANPAMVQAMLKKRLGL